MGASFRQSIGEEKVKKNSPRDRRNSRETVREDFEREIYVSSTESEAAV